jgi:hypothetical protein
MWSIRRKKDLNAIHIPGRRSSRDFVEHALWEYDMLNVLHKKVAVYCPLCFCWYIPEGYERTCSNAQCDNFERDVEFVYPKYHEEENLRLVRYEMYRLPPEKYKKKY